MSVPIKAHLIEWNHHAYQRYLYGMTIQNNERNQVILESGLIPPTAVLLKWESQLNYQMARHAVTLPLLIPNQPYYVAMKVQTVPQNSVYLRLNFYDQHDQLLQTDVIKSESGQFVYPSQAVHYTMELVNMCSQQIVYDKILLSEMPITSDDVLWVSSVMNADTSKACLTIIFEEPTAHFLGTIPTCELETLANYVMIQASAANDTFYLDEQSQQLILNYMEQSTFDTLRLVGYGPISNLAASYYAAKVEKATAYGTTAQLDEQKLEQCRQQLGLKQPIAYQLDIIYAEEPIRQIHYLIDYSHQLSNFIRDGRANG